MSFEVGQPILNSPFDEPQEYWYIHPGETPERRTGRRPAMVFQPREQRTEWDLSDGTLALLAGYERAYELVVVNRIRERVGAWRAAGYPGVTRTTDELLRWWRRDGRAQHLFFAQLEAAETVIFLTEARADFRQGIELPRDEPGANKLEEGFTSFLRYACKMATGAGKTTVMGMLAAWSILNKVSARADGRFSDAVLVVCPNVTIRDRLRELDPAAGEASLYRTRDLVPPHSMPLLSRGRVLVTNWHVFEPQVLDEGGVTGRVMKRGVAQDRDETIFIGDKTTTAHGKRYMTLADYTREVNAQRLFVKGTSMDEVTGDLKEARVYSRRWVESDTALLQRILGREIGGKQNILVFNDEAHHAYRIRPSEDDGEEPGDVTGEAEGDDELVKEATIWVDGLDRVHKHRGINLCVDLSATPYFLARVGRDTARPFPWTVSDFGLVDAIESGLVKIPQLAVRDTSGEERAEYFNIWKWILEKKLTSAERGGRKQNPKPEAILKYAAHPIAMLAAQWRETFREWAGREDGRPPVLILVCKDTKIAKTVFEWVAEDRGPSGILPLGIDELRNRADQRVTIRVDSKVVAESDRGGKTDDVRWMRFTLDTVGRLDWPRDSQGRAIYPSGFEELAAKLERPLTPPGRDIRCIVSVGMLTEGWDANTVTHIIGIRPFMSQLLCEQVVGRGLRRASYDLNEDGRFDEEVAQVFGVPFEVIPFKATGGGSLPKQKRFHVHSLPARASLAMIFPRVEGYTQAVRSRVAVEWSQVAPIVLDPAKLPTVVQTSGLTMDSRGRPATHGSGSAHEITLDPYRADQRVQARVFQLAKHLTLQFSEQRQSTVPRHVLFPQLLAIAQRFVREKVVVPANTDLLDLFLPAYYTLAVERLMEAIRPDVSAGEAPEVPRYESSRGPGSTADVDYWTSKDVRDVAKSHVNYVVADTKAWEQQAAFYIDRHARVEAFVKNAGLGFAIPYFHDGQTHDYVPDFVVRFVGRPGYRLILEVKGFDPLEEVKAAAARRWVSAVNADGKHGEWEYRVARSMADVSFLLDEGATAPS